MVRPWRTILASVFADLAHASPPEQASRLRHGCRDGDRGPCPAHDATAAVRQSESEFPDRDGQDPGRAEDQPQERRSERARMRLTMWRRPVRLVGLRVRVWQVGHPPGGRPSQPDPGEAREEARELRLDDHVLIQSFPQEPAVPLASVLMAATVG